MYEYLVGKVNYLNANYLIMENNFLGYKVYVSDTSKYELNKFQKVYLYTKIYQNIKNNFNYEFYGFRTLSEKIFFESLLNINGIGVKIALTILRNDLNLVKTLIKNQDVSSLEALEGFNNKIATNVVGQLSYKMNLEPETKSDSLNKNQTNILGEAISALKSLGYKKHEIEKAVSNIDKNILENSQDVSDLISCAIKIILNNEATAN